MSTPMPAWRRGSRSIPARSIGPGAEIGAGTVIGPGAAIGPNVRIGRDCSVGAGATLSHALLGNRVIVHPGARIGQDGFGFHMGATHLKVPQVGRVIIQDDVEIGANTTIDRGASRDTVIGEGTKIDNLVQIAHNVVIGRHCVIVSGVGISGSRRWRITSSSAARSAWSVISASGAAPRSPARRTSTATCRPAAVGGAPRPSLFGPGSAS